MWLERLIIRKAEKRLKSYRIQAKTAKENSLDEYNEYLSKIKSLYTSTTHWHGTGRYHYRHQKESRYTDVQTNATTDILAAILRTNGLKPHLDPWIDSGGETVSLATTRMHARTFARIHATSNSSFLYELGSIKYWLRLYFILLFIWLIGSLRRHLSFIKSLLQTSVSKDVQNWASAIRKPHNGKVIGVFDMFKGNVPTSDILDNYPVLIGIKTDSSELIETIPLTHKVEQRSLKPIAFEMLTHLEVPYEHVTETKKILEVHNVSLPVIPLEFGDIYLADKPLQELAFS